MATAAHTLPRELRAEVAYRLDPRRFEHVKLPVLLLMGSDSPPSLKTGAEMFHGILPMSLIMVLPGQQHVAHYTAPDMLARKLQAFLVGVTV